MKKMLVRLGRIALAALVWLAWYAGMRVFVFVHADSCPELYGTPMDKALIFIPLLLMLAMLPFIVAGIGRLSGYRLHRIHWLFLEIAKPDKLRIRLTKKLGWAFRMLPPRTDGTSPYVLYWLGQYLTEALLALLFGVLTAIFWRTPASRYLYTQCWVWLLLALAAPLLPTRGNGLAHILAFRKSRDLRRGWECNLHLTAALDRKVKLRDMPEEWFLPVPAALQDEPLVRYYNFNRAAWLISQDRYTEGYEALRYFFDLEPKPDTHGMIASAILNGVVCEALGDLPYRCLSQLDHPSLKRPLPPAWETQRLQAEYARALFLRHDEAEAAAILPKLEAALEKDGRTREGIEKLQRKAGLLYQDGGTP